MEKLILLLSVIMCSFSVSYSQNNNSTVEQNGNNHVALVQQRGYDNETEIVQTVNDNWAEVIQIINNNAVIIDQVYGANNIAQIRQMGDQIHTFFRQEG